jgi:ribosomal protein S18 acetylase RimI-like enzyme
VDLVAQDQGADGREMDDVIVVNGDEGTLSLELMPLREGVARGFLRFSPRSLKPSTYTADELSRELCQRLYGRILVQDNKKGLLKRALAPKGWAVDRAIAPSVEKRCSVVTTYDIPIDEMLQDSNGFKPDITNTSHMSGISIDLGPRKVWAFFTDDGETARVVSEGERRQGMLVAKESEDFYVAADCLVHYLAALRKSWAVFSTDMGRFIRKFDPTTLWRMELDRPVPTEHVCSRASGENRRALVRLFSEYYDESTLQASFRLRRYRTDRNYAVYHKEGGFVITRLDGQAGLIYDIYVTPSRQGEGLGAELMRCGLTDLAGKVSSCYLHTSYPRAKRLYEKFGFRTVHTQLGIRLDELALTPPTAK